MYQAIPYIIMAVAAAYAGYSSYQTNEYNAKIAEQDAKYALSKGQADEAQHLERMRKQMATAKVAVAGSGVSLMSNSAQDVFDENLEEGMYDAVMIRYQSEAEANSLMAKAKGFKKSARFAAIGGLLGVGANAAEGYAATRKTGSAEKTSTPKTSSGSSLMTTTTE